jgi:arylsulfatase A-like enzyme
LIDFAVLLSGLLLLFILYKLLPALDFSKLSKRFKITILSVCLVFFTFSFIENPFSLKKHVSGIKYILKRNYDSQGNYLGSLKGFSIRKFNIILFSIDTLRADGLSCYGNSVKTSPKIDELSTEGVLFRNALSQSSWTLPSHMTMFTSLYPSVHGCITPTTWTKSVDPLDNYWITLPEILKSFGYSTVAFTDGKLLGPTFNFNQGFDICDDSGGGIDKISQKVIKWLEDYSFSKPFFLFLHCYDVHRYKPPKYIEKMFTEGYKGKLLKLRKAEYKLEQRVTANAFYNLDEDDINHLRNLYNAEIYKTDSKFGEILNYLKERNLYKDALIIITSDHGEEFWEHGGTGHGWSLHQHQLRVPLIIKFPDNAFSGRKIQELVGVIDIAPTILDILGIPAPEEFQGISLLPLIKDNAKVERYFIAEASLLGNQKCIIYKKHSLLFNKYPPIGENIFNWRRFLYVWRNILNFSENELFDLANDPGEKLNILSKKLELANKMEIILLREIDKNLTFKASSVSVKRVELNKETREHLKSLGYIK